MPELLALDLPPGPMFVEAMCSAWESGDAVLPLDPRLPRPAIERLIDALRPTRVVSSEGTRALPGGGAATEEGDALVVATSGTAGEPKGVVLLGGAAPPTALPDNVVTTYGMTETGSGLVYDGVPLEGAEVRLGDGSLGSSGEILVRGPMLLRAYRDGYDPRLAGGWLPTGD